MKVGVVFPSRFGDPGDFLADARAMEAAGVDSIWLEDDGGLDPIVILAAIAAVTSQVRLGFVQAPPSGKALDTLQRLSRDRVIKSIEGWRRVKAPLDRDDWAQTIQDAERDGLGVLVTMAPGLLDLLRHPQDTIDRTDLVLAQG